MCSMCLYVSKKCLMCLKKYQLSVINYQLIPLFFLQIFYQIAQSVAA